MIRIFFLLCLLAGALLGTESSTTINVSANQSGGLSSWMNHTTQVALTTSEVITVFTSTPNTWVYVQFVSPSNWTLRSTQSSTTDAIPVLANQVLTMLVTGTGQTWYPVGSTTQTLYVMPLATTTPKP